MFNFFTKSKSSSLPPNYQELGTDMHSHLLPGIDDGSRDMESTLSLIRSMQELGYKKFITTPHILWDMYKNTNEIILAKLEEVRKAAKEDGLDVSIYAAAEYYLDEHVAELLEEKKPLLTLKDNLVLSEFSLAYPPQGLKDILFEMQMQKYVPVIAHPERYIYLERNKEFYDELKDLGCMFQLNLLSLSGHYGKTVQELANYLIKKEYYDFIGTDLHGERHLAGLQSKSLTIPLQKLLDTGKIKNHLL